MPGRGDDLVALREQRPAARRRLARPLEAPVGRAVERRLEAAEEHRAEIAVVEARRAGLRLERAVGLDSAPGRSTSAPTRAATRDRERTAPRSSRARRAISGPRPCSSRTASRRPRSRRPTGRRRRGAAGRSPPAARRPGARCRSPTRRARARAAVSSAPIAARSRSSACRRLEPAGRRDADARARRVQRPEQPEVLLVRRHDLVVRAEAEPGEDDVAAVRGRRRQRDVLGRHAGSAPPACRARARAALACPRVVPGPGAALGEVDERLRDHRLGGRPGERPVRAGVEVGDALEDGERRPGFLEGHEETVSSTGAWSDSTTPFCRRRSTGQTASGDASMPRTRMSSIPPCGAEKPGRRERGVEVPGEDERLARRGAARRATRARGRPAACAACVDAWMLATTSRSATRTAWQTRGCSRGVADRERAEILCLVAPARRGSRSPAP